MQGIIDAITNLSPNGGLITTAAIVIGVVTYFTIDWRSERRARDTFGIERRRLTEVNLKVDYDLALTVPQPGGTSGETAYLSLRLPIQNIGDGPVDLLAVLTSGRLLSPTYRPGVGSRSRDVEWSDFQPFYWNDERANDVFVGISTTKNTISRAEDFTRLAARESGTLRRIDAVNDMAALMKRDDLLLRHRVFVVARGYPLGEILRQLGGGPPDPAVSVEQGSLQFQTLAVPLYQRWQTVQQALINLNRFVFRIAIFDPAKPEQSGDPLGFLTEPDAWRIFLLYHWEFVNEATTAPKEYRKSKAFTAKERVHLPNFTQIIDDLTQAVKEHYPDLILPPDWLEQRATVAKVQQMCLEKLAPFVEIWNHMRATIDACRAYPTGRDDSERGQRASVDEGYPALIFNDPYYERLFATDGNGRLLKNGNLSQTAAAPGYEPNTFANLVLHKRMPRRTIDFQERWYALMIEGYLVSKPFRQRAKLFGLPLFWRRRTYNITRDVPSDPRILEPFVIRSYSYMTSVATPKAMQAAKFADKPRIL